MNNKYIVDVIGKQAEIKEVSAESEKYDFTYGGKKYEFTGKLLLVRNWNQEEYDDLEQAKARKEAWVRAGFPNVNLEESYVSYGEVYITQYWRVIEQFNGLDYMR